MRRRARSSGGVPKRTGRYYWRSCARAKDRRWVCPVIVLALLTGLELVVAADTPATHPTAATPDSAAVRGPLPDSPAAPERGATRDIVVSVSAIAAALFAFLGVNVWRHQLKGTTEYNVALEVLKAVYAVREAVVEARGRMPLPSEWAHRSPGQEGPEEVNVQFAAQAYQQRLARLRDARANLLQAQQEALALWGDAAKDALQDLFGAIDDLFTTCGLYYDEEIARARRKDQEGKEELQDIDHVAMHRTLYSGVRAEGRDAFAERIARAIAKGEEFYRARLK